MTASKTTTIWAKIADWYVTHIQSLDTSIQVIFYGILAVGLLTYWVWARPHLVKTEAALAQLAAALRGAAGLAQARSVVEPVLTQHPALKDAWASTNSRVVAVGKGERTRFALLGSVDDVWQPERLLHKRFNFAMFEAIPNIAVGVGLLFTFIFLTLALTDATAALTGQTNGSASILDATRSLLASAGGKFMSSLAGLTVSLLWTVVGRRRMVRLQRAASNVVDAIEHLLPPVGAELAVAEQLTQLQAMSEHLAAQQATLLQSQALLTQSQAVLTQSHAVQQDQQALTEELLEQAREQTGSLKRFETDLAVSIGNAITSSFGPQMEAMTKKLVEAITGLSDRMGSMNEEALNKMLKEFAEAMRASSAEEMGKFKDTLGLLADKLADATEGLGTGVGAASDKLSESVLQMTQKLVETTQEMSSRIADASGDLKESIQGVDAAMDKARASVQEVDATISRAAQMGQQGLNRVEGAIESSGQVVQRMNEAGLHWSNAAGALQLTAGKLTDACEGVEELSQEQKAVVAAVRSATPEALQAVNRMTQLLDETTRSAASSLSTVQSAMDRTSRELNGVVASITDGVGQYTQQVAQLHQSMDAEMAKAISSLGGGINNLVEAVEDLNDGLEAFEKK
jgi:methyl-accepting chemotaxis protein